VGNDKVFKVHPKTGPGLRKTVYEVLLAHESRKEGLQVQRQVPIPIRYDELVFDESFRADLLVEDKGIVEIGGANGSCPQQAGFDRIPVEPAASGSADQLRGGAPQKRQRANRKRPAGGDPHRLRS
jgi:hypothetical protein